jgi:hypothetical protein
MSWWKSSTLWIATATAIITGPGAAITTYALTRPEPTESSAQTPDGGAKQPCLQPSPAPAALSTDTMQCIDAARSAGRPYAILTAAMTADISDVGKTRTVSLRIAYTILPLRDIDKSEVVFKEAYTSATNRSALRWIGTNEELIHGTSATVFGVVMDARAHTPYTLVTGAEIVYDLPLKKDRTAYADAIKLGERQEHFAYPNDDDPVCGISITVTSRTTPIRGGGQAAGYLTRNRQLQTSAPLEQDDPRSKSRSVTARWPRLAPHDEVGVIVSW